MVTCPIRLQLREDWLNGEVRKVGGKFEEDFATYQIMKDTLELRDLR